MNQILGNHKQEKSSYPFPSYLKTKKLKWIIFLSLLVGLISIILYFVSQYHTKKTEKISQALSNQFSITTLYTNQNGYLSERLMQITDENNSPFVIGILQIKKINLFYPILSNTNEELLKISPCRFYGPMPNEIGNLCIAGHNYADNTHFGKLSLLSIGDQIQLYDLSGNNLEYRIYSKTEVPAEDTSCVNQDTNGQKEITLVTCNTIKGNRLILKAKENR